MNQQRIIDLDVGCWQSYEEQDPVMTFALIEHDTIALCNYFSNGEILTPSLASTNNEAGYDFRRTLTFKFLSSLFEKKYGHIMNTSSQPSLYHILKLMQFPRRSLLDKDNSLLIFIPDLHLHYFKLSYLDHFITYYSNEWDNSSGKPIKRVTGRISMEDEFSLFLKCIAEFQKRGYEANVYTLGDLTDMWRTKAVIETFLTDHSGSFIKRADLSRIYKGFNALINDLDKNSKNKNLGNILNFLRDLRFEKLPYDSIIIEQISYLRNDQKALEKIHILDNEVSDSLWLKARNLEDEILLKYGNGEDNFNKLFGDIYVVARNGNHDNFLETNSVSPIYTFNLGCFDSNGLKYPNYYEQRETDFLILHGQNLDQYSNDKACGIGYLIVALLILFEGKEQRDLIMKLERMINDESYQNYIRTIASVIHNKDEGNIIKDRKNKVIIHAHTHHPYLEDITDEYNKTRASLLAEPIEPIKEYIKEIFWS